MSRYLVLFAREPVREAREKGFAGVEAEGLFATFAQGWRAAARDNGARLLIATPPEDRLAWARRFADGGDCRWLMQKGSSFGERLEDASRCAASLGGHAVIVGGDVPPSSRTLAAAFAALEGGADAVLAPAGDGGVSLLGLSQDDLDLLRPIASRRRNVLKMLLERLLSRKRRVALLPSVADVDGRRSLRALMSDFSGSEPFHSLARNALRRPADAGPAPPASRLGIVANGPPALRGPPAAA